MALFQVFLPVCIRPQVTPFLNVLLYKLLSEGLDFLETPRDETYLHLLWCPDI